MNDYFLLSLRAGSRGTEGAWPIHNLEVAGSNPEGGISFQKDIGEKEVKGERENTAG